MEEDSLISKNEYIMRQNLFLSGLITKEKWITNSMLDECQREVKGNIFLADVLIQKNYLTPGMVAGIYAKQKIKYCPNCHHQNESDRNASSRSLSCPQCQKTSQLPVSFPFFKVKNITRSMQELCCSDWGSYHIQYCLGSGGMGEVYRAIQKGLNRPVAIKILSPQLANNPQVVKRFQKEARLAAQISHPNLVQIYDVGQHGNYHFIAMEYVNGSPLQKKIPSQQGIPIKNAILYLHESAKGLKALHQREIIHRDIKPDNIMIGDNEVKLTDFGLAKFEDDSQELTKHGAIIGTPYYMAPEQCLGKPATKLSDIYSLGLTFYYMVKGSLPYKGESTLEIITERINYPSPHFRNELPRKIEKIYEKMIADLPEKRYQNIEELILEIQNLTEVDYKKNTYQITKASWKYIAIIFVCLFMIVAVTRSGKRKRNQNQPEQNQEVTANTNNNTEQNTNNGNEVVKFDETTEENILVEENDSNKEAQRLYEKITKQTFSTLEEELFVYQSFLEKYEFFPEKEDLQQRIQAIEENIKKNKVLSDKSYEHVQYLEEKQWEILFSELKELQIKHSDVAIQNYIESNLSEQWKNIQSNIDIFKKINTVQNLSQKKSLLLKLKNIVPEYWSKNFNEQFDLLSQEIKITELWESHFVKLQKQANGRTYDNNINALFSNLQNEIKQYRKAASFRDISNLLELEKEIFSNVRDLWEAYTNNIFEFTESGQMVNVKEAPVEDVTNNAYRICREKNYDENILWISIAFFCILEKNLAFGEKAWKKVAKNEKLETLYNKHLYYAKKIQFEVIEKKENIKNTVSLNDIFHGKIRQINEECKISYNFNSSVELSDFIYKGSWYVENNVLKIPFSGNLKHNSLWRDKWKMELKILSPVIVTIKINSHRFVVDTSKNITKFIYQQGKYVEQKIFSKYPKPILVITIQVENEQIVISDSNQMTFRRKYNGKNIEFEMATVFLGEVQIFSLEMQGILDEEWLNSYNK